jgi:hypothetical protein
VLIPRPSAIASPEHYRPTDVGPLAADEPQEVVLLKAGPLSVTMVGRTDATAGIDAVRDGPREMRDLVDASRRRLMRGFRE